MLTDTQRTNIVTVAESWQGTPFRGHSCLKGAGVDCAQFLVGVYVEAGFFPPGFIAIPKDYRLQVAQHRDDTTYIETIAVYMREIPCTEVKPSDVVIYKIGLAFYHAGIIKAWPEHIIHATELKGVTGGHGLSPSLKACEKKFFTLRDEHCGAK